MLAVYFVAYLRRNTTQRRENLNRCTENKQTDTVDADMRTLINDIIKRLRSGGPAWTM